MDGILPSNPPVYPGENPIKAESWTTQFYSHMPWPGKPKRRLLVISDVLLRARAGDKGYFGQIRTLDLRNSARSSYGTRHGLKSMGILTVETVPGLNRHFRNVLRAALSSWGFPVLCAIEASITLPLPGSTDTTQTPLPVMPSKRALDGYEGAGA
jgi:hypothetical protein